MPTGRIVLDITWSGASGSPGVNVFHARADSLDQFNADFDALSQLLQTFYDDSKSIFANPVTITCGGVVEGVGDDTGSTWQVDPWSVQGTGGNLFMAPQDCMLISWKAATGGRSGRGRTFLGPLTQNMNQGNGTPDESARTGTQQQARDLVAASEAFGNGALGIYSREEDVFRDFVAASIPNYFAVLRSRRD